jgi:hypothetical protein
LQAVAKSRTCWPLISGLSRPIASFGATGWLTAWRDGSICGAGHDRLPNTDSINAVQGYAGVKSLVTASSFFVRSKTIRKPTRRDRCAPRILRHTEFRVSSTVIRRRRRGGLKGSLCSQGPNRESSQCHISPRSSCPVGPHSSGLMPTGTICLIPAIGAPRPMLDAPELRPAPAPVHSSTVGSLTSVCSSVVSQRQ